MNYIEQYYRKIEEGNIVTSDKIRRTYKHLVEKIYDKKGPYRYDDKKAKFAIDFIEAFCKHSKGKWGGKPLVWNFGRRLRPPRYSASSTEKPDFGNIDS